MRRSLVLCFAACAAVSAGCAASEEEAPPVATPAFSVDSARAPLGSPIEVTFRFVVEEDAPSFDEKYRVMVHILDSDEELMWTDDHDPPVATTEWSPGQTIEYSRTTFVPIYPYIGEAIVQVGLYSDVDGSRLPLAGEDMGQRAYKVGTLQLLPQSENIFLIFKEGWHRAEVAPNNAAVEWQWTRKEATLSFRSPQRDALLYLEIDGRPDLFPEPQLVTLSIGEETVTTLEVASRESALHRVPLSAAQLGDTDMVDLRLAVDQTFTPGCLPGTSNADMRELGVRVFHAFVEPQ